MRFRKPARIVIVLSIGTLILFATFDRTRSAAAIALGKPADGASKTYSVYFPKVAVPSDAGIGLVRVVVTCGRIAAVTRIPDDWYVRTLRPAVESGREWSEFRFASNAIDFEAGHGVTRLPSLTTLDGAIKVTVEDDRCFDITAHIADEIGGAWKVRLRKAQLQLRD
jgi:hypothetical protein